MPTNPAVDSLAINSGWQLVRSDPDAAADPNDIRWVDATIDAIVPGTVASSLDAQDSSEYLPNTNHDDYDWWYQCEFEAPSSDYQSIVLQLDGLATIAEVWLNGESIHTSSNMFRSFRLDVTSRLTSKNTLSIVFRSLSNALTEKRPRPSWKTRLVSNQQLRWIRTTLLGRIPGWTPPIQAVGPWREIKLVCGRSFAVEAAHVRPQACGTKGKIAVEVILENIHPSLSLDFASISVNGKTYQLSTNRKGGALYISGQIEMGEIQLWNPNGYGEPRLYDYTLSISSDGKENQIKVGRIGFRSVELDRNNGRVQFVVNHQKLFARGGCWSTNDITSLIGDPDKLRRILNLIQQAGGNMIRVGGTMVYETHLFYSLCDELGIAVWQDFMFANMDYPSDDQSFMQDVTLEIEDQLGRLREHPCVVVYCGNSEVEQQAAMFGMTEEVWHNPLFYEVIPSAVEKHSPGIPYFPSSPCEGALPFHNTTGPSHYFGVGAYKQSLDDLAKSNVKFASECLAFSNFPADESLREHFGTTTPAVHHPSWKAGVPRDSATGWDFEDVRDHYIKRLYGVDAVDLRYFDKSAYAALSQVVPGEVMGAAFDFWRGKESDCSGGLIWFLNDIVPGAGWGIIDSDGRPKPPYYFLKRSWSETNLSIQDLGMDGLLASVSNDSSISTNHRLVVKVLQHSRVCIAESSTEFEVQSKHSKDILIDELLGRFFDTAHRYRFGPPNHDVIVMTLVDENGQQELTKCFFPGNRDLRKLDRANVQIDCSVSKGLEEIQIQSDCFLQHVKLFSRTHEFDDNYFHLAPGISKTVIAKQIGSSARPLRGTLSAINLMNQISFN